MTKNENTSAGFSENPFDIAIVGMACRFPGAGDIHEFWNNLSNGVESIRHFSDAELKNAGIPESLINNPKYVKASPVLKDPGLFDARFFGFTPNEARMMDPQHRILLECAQQTLEQAGYDPLRYNGRIGVFTGSAMNTYFMNDFFRTMFIEDYIPTLIANDKDFLSTQISYKLNLKGPSVNVQTACSTSLVAVHLACQSLINQESDLVLAGAVSVKVPHVSGYIYDGGGVVSPDAHVRAFDAKANGTVFGSGAGLVLLKRLSDAINDGDTIHAVIKSTAINNDGSQKAGYTAPSVTSQAEAITEALSVADINPESISYIEAHGSGTPIGDPIEVAALTKAFRNFTNKKNFCAIGSVKTNVGHLDVAAGIAGLIKTVLALKNKKIPPSLNYEEPNPEIDFEDSPFFVSTKLSEWKSESVLRAGIMSTGMGGTNAHVIIEEAPQQIKKDSSESPKIFLLSAKSDAALNDYTSSIKSYLNHPEINLDDTAYTLQIGRKNFNHRRFFIGKNKEELLNILSDEKSKQVFSDKVQSSAKRPIVFMFPGIGDHYVGMGFDLYHNSEIFKSEVDKCADILKKYLDIDIREIIYPKDFKRESSDSSKGIDFKKMLASRVDKSADTNTQKLNQTLFAQPALFTIEYSLAKLLMHYGVTPDAIIGHSMGEYVAACLSGVFSLEDSLKLIASRARLVNSLPQSSMLAVNLPEKEILPLLSENLSISLINLPNLCVVAGAEDEIKILEEELKSKKVLFRYIQNAHAFHSKSLNPILKDFEKEFKNIKANKPVIPFTSNLTGDWVTEDEIRKPGYWSKHANSTARFSDALEKAWEIKNSILLEIGPGNTLSVLAMQHPQRMKAENPVTITTLRASYDSQSDNGFLLSCLGKLWLKGVSIDWENIYKVGEKHCRIPLPTYPFQRENYWVDDLYTIKENISFNKPAPSKRKEFNDWFSVPEWVESNDSNNEDKIAADDALWILFMDESGFAESLKNEIQNRSQNIVLVEKGEVYHKKTGSSFTINPHKNEDYSKLFSELSGLKFSKINILHCWCISEYKSGLMNPDDDQINDIGFYSLVYIAQSLTKYHFSQRINIGVYSTNTHKVVSTDEIYPANALITGPVGVFPKEFSNISSFNLDFILEEIQSSYSQDLLNQFVNEFNTTHSKPFIAYRNKIRYVKEYKPINITSGTDADSNKKNLLRKNGVYVITGGTGGIGLTISKYLAENYQAKIIFTQKSEMPLKSQWTNWLEQNSPESGLLYQKISRLLEMEKAGAEVSVFTADVCDKPAMKNVFDETLKRYGRIDGVIHAAGIVKAGIALAKTKETADEVLDPKVRGTIILNEILENIPIEFLVLFSSVTSVITPFAEVDYSSANAFLDSYTDYSVSNHKFHTLCINWPGWKDIGQLKNLVPLKGTEKWKEKALESAIAPEDGLKAFLNSLSSGLHQVIVSPEPLFDSEDELHSSQFFEFDVNVTQPRSKTRTYQDAVVIDSSDSGTTEAVENKLVILWQNILGYDNVQKDDNFFDLGGHSLLMGRLQIKINEVFNEDLSLVDLYQYPTIKTLAKFITNKKGSSNEENISKTLITKKDRDTDIAIIGMAGRYPKSLNLKEFWKNLVDGVEVVSFFSDDELEYTPKGSTGSELKFVKARGVLEDADKFDAEFFGYNPREAALMDPQHRVFLEVAWEALEDAGYNADNIKGAVGVFAGSSLSTYLMYNVLSDREKQEEIVNSYQISDYSTVTGNDNSFLTTKVAYKLGLRGPAVNIQTACSTSLVAIGQAYQNLLSGECDMALAGGVSITFPQKRGYFFVEGSIGSVDGHCKTFDAEATGTVFSSAAGIVVLKRLKDAIKDGDSVYAVIKSVATNNDGADKAGYMTPSVEGQSEVIRKAQLMAGIDASTIKYIEAHGTGTPVGDPIEVASLEKAFRETTVEKQFCGIGSVKSNLGHTDTAAGVTGLIKTALSLYNKVIPPTLHYNKPNPRIDFEKSPFYVVDKLTDLSKEQRPLRAAVSAFGVGGTNAHAILEEFPSITFSCEERSDKYIIPFSAKTENALTNNILSIQKYFESSPGEGINDIAYTLQTGRKEFEWRQFVVAGSINNAASELTNLLSTGMNRSQVNLNDNPFLVFMFPGQGAQYVNMGKGLYSSEKIFAETVDYCAEYLIPLLDLDIRDLLFPKENHEETAKKLEQTVYTQPALFIIEYALARLIISYGINPQAMIGHSVGDYVSACLASVFSLDDALYIIAKRATLMQKQKPGSMLSVRLGEEQIKKYLNENISLAAINSPNLVVVSGQTEKLKQLSSELTESKIENRLLFTSHAYHSSMMEPALKPFAIEFDKITLNNPSAPFLSSMTGTWITNEQAVDKQFWVLQLSNPVRFSNGIKELQKKNNLVLLELGPGRALSTMASQHRNDNVKQVAITTLTQPDEVNDDKSNILSSIGKLWLAGMKIAWNNFYPGQKRRRLHLPTYQFDRKSYWIEPPKNGKAKDKNNYSKQISNSVTKVVKRPAIKKVIQANSMKRKEYIIDILKDILVDLSGMKKTDLVESKSFLELGFDSLFMTQVSLAFQKKFDVKITLRQLLESTPTILAIADFIDGKLPSGQFEPPKQEVVIEEPVEELVEEYIDPAMNDDLSSGIGSIVGQGSVEKLVYEQLELMKKQLEMLSGKVMRTIPQPVAKHPEQKPVDKTIAKPEVLPQQKTDTAEKKVFERFGPYKPIETKKGAALTDQQQKYLDKLIKDYNRKTIKSKNLTQQHRSHYADPRTVAGFLPIWKEMTYQVVTERSQGSRVWDIDGNEYVDVLMGFGQYLFGHNPKFIKDAIVEQMNRGFEIGPQSPIAGEVAKLICEFTGLDRAAFCVTGSEAVLGAIRAARTVTGRDKIIFFAADYHGIIDEVLVKTNAVNDQLKTMPIAPGIPRENVQNSIVLEFGTEESLKTIEKLLPEIAAVMVEPVQARRPDFQPKDFLVKLRQITEAANVPLIFDEVVTGFRVGPGGAQEYYGIKADIATYGKVIGGGFPIGIIAGKKLYMDAFDGGWWQYGDDSIPEAGVTFFAGTFARHPLSLTGAYTALNYLKAKNGQVQKQLGEKTARLAKELNEFLVSRNMPLKIINFSSIFYYSYPKDLTYFSLLFYVLRNKGLHILEGFPVFLSEAHTDADVDFIIDVIKQSIIELQDNGFFPAPLGSQEISKQSALVDHSSGTNKIPLTEAQKELWVASLMNDKASCTFNESSHLVLKGKLNKENLEKAFEKIIERHEALRTTFSQDGKYQIVNSQSRFKLVFTDLTNNQQRDSIVTEKINSESSKVFDLINGPLIRAELIRLNELDHRLIITAHHIICDGWSYDVMVKDLSRIYSEEEEHKPTTPAQPMQMREFVSFLEESQKTNEYKEQENYWLKQLALPIAECELPTDFSRPEVRTFNGARINGEIEKNLFKKVRELSAKSGSTLFVTLISGFSLLLNKLAQEEDIVTGIPAAGQQVLGADDLVGHCTNLLPIRFKINPEMKFSEYLKHSKGLVLDAYDNQQVTYGDLIGKLKLKRSANKAPLISTMFNIDPAIMGLKFSGLEAEFLANPISGYQFEFGFNLVNSQDECSIECDYNPDLFSKKTVENYIRYYNYILEQVTEDIDITLKDIKILSPSEIADIMNF
ncbi:MAG: aminotransferase class III-fold pyridoxal phosphate-dependent enzyme [Ignavibacteriales bacterium]|nr:MAG: aminotransferase class III-fold pyridoxal phosphate-dependent enzyme [Ignavibacteriales bacterium]